MAKQVQQLDRVIIRFAGDSGDGMQLAGDRFTQETAAFGNDLSTLPNFPAEIRAPAGTLPGVSSFQLHFADHDILTPGDAPDVLVAMNPAALKANLADLPRGADIIANTDEFSKRNLSRVGYEASPLDDGSLAGYNVHAVAITSMTGQGAGEVRHHPQGRRAGQEHVRARAALLAVQPAAGGHDHVPGVQVRRQARDHEGEHRGLPGGLELRRDDRGVLGPVRSQAGQPDSRAPTATSPATSHSPTAWSPPPGGPGCRCSSAPTRSPRPRTSCTSCPSSSGSVCAPSRPRTRSRAWARRSAPPSVAPSASPPPPVPA